MNDALARVGESPILLAIVVFLVGGLVYGLLKKVAKLALIFVLGFVALFGWFAYTGQEPPDAMRRMAETAKKKVERGAEIGKQKAREVGEKLGEELEKAARETLEDGGG